MKNISKLNESLRLFVSENNKVEAPQILSKLFPQTSTHNLDETAKAEEKKKEEEEKQEQQNSYKRMKYG